MQPLFTCSDVQRANHHGYAVGDVVWVKPNDAKISRGKIIGFQKVSPYLPIVKGKTPDGVKFSSAFTLDRINLYRKGKKFPVLKIVYE